MGWLHAKREEKLGTRWDEYVKGRGKTPPLPEVDPLNYLRDIWNTWGKCGSNGMGLSAFSSQDIQGIIAVEQVTPVEGRVLRLMSANFVYMMTHAKDPFILPPWDGES